MYDALLQACTEDSGGAQNCVVWRPDDFTRVLCQVAHACNHATANILTRTPLLNAIKWGMNL